MLICIYSFYTVLHVAARFLFKIVKMWVSPLVHDAFRCDITLANHQSTCPIIVHLSTCHLCSNSLTGMWLTSVLSTKSRTYFLNMWWLSSQPAHGYLQQNTQSEPLANASVRIVDIMNKNELRDAPINVTIIINHGAELRGAPINIAIIIWL